jgi:hypothetical protein
MKMHNPSRNLSLLSVAYLAILFLFVFIMGWLDFSLGETGFLIFAVMYCCALVPLGLLTGSWLVWRNRDQFSKTFIWLAFQVVFIVSMAMYSTPLFGLFFSSLLFLLFPLLGFVNFLYASQEGASLRLMGWGSVGFIWSVLIAWRIKGDLIKEMISSFGTNANNLWWLYALMYVFACIVVIGVLTFIVETFQILRKEYLGRE